ncbi:MAG: lipid A biosynthesis acyltransferase, partial [Acidobacteria bacterium]
MRHRLEYALAWLIVKFLGALPRPLARAAGISLGWIIYLLHHQLRSVGIRNLALAYPEKSRRERARILRGVFTSLGRQLAEVCLFPKHTRENIAEVVVYDGFENFERAVARGKGVLFLTGHLGGWELSAFAHSLYGHPLHVVMRALDNPYLDQLSRQYRTMHGNSMIDKDEPVRALLSAMKA